MIYKYRVLHRLGERYATPALFLDIRDAEKYLAQKKRTYRKLGLTDLANGWYIESCPKT